MPEAEENLVTYVSFLHRFLYPKEMLFSKSALQIEFPVYFLRVRGHSQSIDAAKVGIQRRFGVFIQGSLIQHQSSTHDLFSALLEALIPILGCPVLNPYADNLVPAS